jgi:hypothetical protein
VPTRASKTDQCDCNLYDISSLIGLPKNLQAEKTQF